MEKNLLFVLIVVGVFYPLISRAQLSGTYTIGGASPDYATFSAAVIALNTNGVSGPVTFNVRTGTYNENIIITVSGTSTNTITFQSESGNSSDVTLTYSSASSSLGTVKLDGADYITFRKMTIQATGASYSRVIYLKIGVNNTTIQNCRLIGSNTTSSSTDLTVVYSSSSSSNHNTIIENNDISYGSYGIYLKGSSSSNLENGTEIKNNNISNFEYCGIYLEYHNAAVIRSNTIIPKSIQGPTTYGIYTYYVFGPYEITKNKMSAGGSSTTHGIRLENSDATIGNKALVANNMITITSGSNSLRGIYLKSSDYVQVFYNSINVTGGSSDYAALQYYSGTGDEIKNNIIVNTGGGYAIWFNLSGPACDYNDLYVTGSYLGNDDHKRTNLAAWQAATGQDANSISVDPAFNSSTDLHITVSSPISLKAGTSLTGIVNDDYDGEARDGSTPYMGLDESDLPLPVELVSFAADVIDNSVVLKWRTETEVDNYGFEIQRLASSVSASSSNNEEPRTKNFSTISFVEGAGNSNSPKDYSFTDYLSEGNRFIYRLKQIDTDGTFDYSQEVEVEVEVKKYELFQNYPNPFNPTTTIKYSIPNAGNVGTRLALPVQLIIYDILGNKIATLVNEQKPPGVYEIEFNASNIASGIYFYRLQSKDYVITKKMMLVK